MLEELIKGEINQNEILNYYNANVTYTSLPKKINGFVFEYRGISNIIINSNISYYKKKKTLIHELAHVELNQLCQCNKDLFAFYIDKYEDDADKYVSKIRKNLSEELK